MGLLIVALIAASLDGGSDAAPLETVVTATRDARPRRDVPLTVVVLPADELARSSSLTVDGALRAEPSAATFRRNTSLVADPTAQGVNLRGVGPSGVSRALVLLDGAPVNDPFGGWVFWRSLPRLGLDRIELVPGPGSALYGSAALGGVVQLITRGVSGPVFEGEVFGGNLGTVLLAARTSDAWELGGASVEAGVLHTDGFRIVGPDVAGPIDQPARSEDVSVSTHVELRPRDDSRLSLRVSYFDQAQNGGTAFTDSRIELFSGAASFEWRAPGGGRLQASLFARTGEFRQRRARIGPGRATEALAGEQQVPLADQGAGLTWHFARLRLLGEHTFSAGFDVRRATGTSRERSFPAGGGVVERETGGEQQLGGVFVQDLVSLGAGVELLASLRADGWRNLDGTGAEAPRQEGQVSPRGGILWRPLDALALRASVGAGFRAPTLNELYRPFQVGTILTGANAALVAERLLGAEAGVEVAPVDGVVGRVTGFWNRLENPVTNVTLGEALPGGATRQRQNLGADRIWGVEAALQARLFRRWTALLGYTFVDARVVEAGATALAGRRLAQDPQHRGSFSLTFDDPRLFTATAEARVVGPQFEDDLNTLEMAGYVVVNLTVSRRLWRGLELVGAIENLLDRRYWVGRAGVDTYGQPFTARLGLRLR